MPEEGGELLMLHLHQVDASKPKLRGIANLGNSGTSRIMEEKLVFGGAVA